MFRPTRVSLNEIVYKCNNTFLVLENDGLDPVSGHLDDVIVVSGSLVVYCVSYKTLYFENHYHSYIIEGTSAKKCISTLWDHNVYHAHKLKDRKLYVMLFDYCSWYLTFCIHSLVSIPLSVCTSTLDTSLPVLLWCTLNLWQLTLKF